MPYIDCSIIITTRNEERHIKGCLESIRAEDYPQDRIEVIVVDNNSTDRTKEIAGRYTPKVYDFGPERSAQRNFGAKQAIGKYILYLDADMSLAGTVVRECVEQCEQSGFIALYIPERITGQGFWIRVRDFERGFYNATHIDAVRFVNKDVFLKVGGFDEGLTGPEDWDLDIRINKIGKTGIINSPIYHNEGKFSLRRYLKKKDYYSKDFRKYIQKWGKNHKNIKHQFGIYYRYLGVFIENGRWKRLLANPSLTLGMYFLRVMVGFAVMKRSAR